MDKELAFFYACALSRAALLTVSVVCALAKGRARTGLRSVREGRHLRRGCLSRQQDAIAAPGRALITREERLLGDGLTNS